MHDTPPYHIIVTLSHLSRSLALASKCWALSEQANSTISIVCDMYRPRINACSTMIKCNYSDVWNIRVFKCKPGGCKLTFTLVLGWLNNNRYIHTLNLTPWFYRRYAQLTLSARRLLWCLAFGYFRPCHSLKEARLMPLQVNANRKPDWIKVFNNSLSFFRSGVFSVNTTGWQAMWKWRKRRKQTNSRL